MEFFHDNFFDNVLKEVSCLAFIDGLGKEDKSLIEFISSFYQDAVGKNMVSTSQEMRRASAIFYQIVLEKVEIQLSTAALVRHLSPSQAFFSPNALGK